MRIAKEFKLLDFLGPDEFIGFQAREQVAGQGQHENQWISPVGNCYITYVLQTKSTPYYASLVASLAVADTVNSYLGSNHVKLKWINDVYYGSNKIAGVLCNCENISDRKICES